MSEFIDKVWASIFEDCRACHSYYQLPEKTPQQCEKVVLSVIRLIGVVFLGMGASNVWGSLPIIGNNSIDALLKGSVRMFMGHEIFIISTNYRGCQEKRKESIVPVQSAWKAGKLIIAKILGRPSENCPNGFDPATIKELTQGTLLSFIWEQFFGIFAKAGS